MHWKNNEDFLYEFDVYSYRMGLRYRAGEINGTPTLPFNYNYTYKFRSCETIIPKTDVSGIKQQFTTKVAPDSVLYFDESSNFPRYKLTIGTNKRCIKPAKAKFIVVNELSKPVWYSETYYIFKSKSDKHYLISENAYDEFFKCNLNTLLNQINQIQGIEDLELVYSGPIMLLDKSNNYIFKGMNGDYTQQFITDEDLDKQINELCPEPTVDELISIIDMLDSDDDSVVKLGTKMLSGYNVTKYPLTFRLILYTRTKGWQGTRNTVATKQMVESLHINGRFVNDYFPNCLYYVEEDDYEYTAEDVALAKQVCAPMVEKFLNDYGKQIAKNHYQFLPNHVTIKAE